MLLERMLENTLGLQAIPAPTGQEGPRAARLRDLLAEAGLDQIERDDLGNLYAATTAECTHPITVVSAHLDSVFPPEQNRPAERKGNRLIGPGIGDNALGLSVLIELAYDLQDMPVDGCVWLVANVAEEGMGNLEGMRAVVERFRDAPRAYLVLEGLGLGQLYHQALPARRYRIRAETEGGHAWIHANRPSAIHALLHLGTALAEMKLPKNPRTTLNIGLVQGGTSVNTIADHAIMEVDIRSYRADALTQIEMAMRKLCAQASGRQVRIFCETVGERPSGGIPADHPLVRAAAAALNRQGVRPARAMPASTDASIPLSLELPALCMGLTQGAGAHSQNEYIEIDPIRKGYAAVLEVIGWLMAQ